MTLQHYILEIEDNKRHSKEYIENNFKKIGEGSEGDVYSDGNYAYKIVQDDLVASPEKINNNIINHKNVVKIYDSWYDLNDYYIIIKMELLEELPLNKVDEDEYEHVQELLWNSEDDINIVKRIYNKIKDPEIKKMVEAIINVFGVIDYVDVGFHNLMYNPKTKEYKQIDIF